MKYRLRQAGFTAIEAIVALVIVAALVGVGVWVMSREPAPSSETSDVQANTEAPAVEDADDLTKAETTLDQSNLDAGSSDNEDIDQELSNF